MRAALFTMLFASAAQAQHFASEKRFEVRAGLSLLWSTTTDASNSGNNSTTGGFFPLDFGAGFRPTPDTSVALMGRIGVLHYGGGLEFAKTFAGDWSQSGLVVRAGPQIIRDFIACLTIEGPRTCDTATYFMLEAGAGYRWAFRSTGGFSIGASLTAGSQRLALTGGGTSTRFAYGLLAPRFAFDF